MSRNASLIVPGYGTYRVPAIKLLHGITVIGPSTTEASARNRRGAFVTKISSGGFTLWTWVSRAEYTRFTNWLRGYADHMSALSPDLGPMRVIIPGRDRDRSGKVLAFDKVGILRSTIPMDDDATSIGWEIVLSWEGTSDFEEAERSIFKVPKTRDEQNAQPSLFFPAGTQLSGDAVTDSSVYEAPEQSEITEMAEGMGISPRLLRGMIGL